MVCSSCNDPVDDANCKAAYPPAALCLAGVCAAGNCRVDTDCATAGEICGAQQPNFCGKCTSDGECHADPTYGPNFICDTAAGTCVSNACTSNDHACPNNAKDFCCALKCVPGNCCVDADCTGSNQTCKNNKCTTCALVVNNTYYVDPKSGDDGAGTGSSATGGACAFQTITRALEFIGPTPKAGTKIEILNTAAVVAPPEAFPITVPANVTIEGAVAGTPATITLPTNVTAFHLGAAASGLNNLIVDGAMGAGTSGVLVFGGATATTTITAVEVRNMAGNGINAQGGQVTIGSGTNVHNNGTAAAPASGLSVYGTAKVTITVNTGETAAQFSSNAEHGILVQAAGSVTIGGTLAPAVKASENAFAGLYIFQTPGNAVPPNVVTGFSAVNSSAGNGIHIFGGSSLQLRNSQTKGNKFDGIVVQTYVNGTTKSDNMALIDLGNITSPGGNTLQYATGNGPNGGAGICLALTPTAAQTLNAEGNIFEAANCANAATTLVGSATCAGGADYGITGAATTNKINLTKCM
jgi:hypothetical protein